MYCLYFPGYCVDLTKHVAEYVNIDYKIQLVKDNTYGKRFPNGTWNGMIGELVRGVSQYMHVQQHALFTGRSQRKKKI